MAAESSSGNKAGPRDTGHDQAETSIDDLIRDILNDAGVSPESGVGGRTPAASLIETVIAHPRGTSHTSTLERLLLAEAVASALAEALAPALAEALAPHVMKVMERSTTSEPADKSATPAHRPSERGRKS